MKGEVCSNQVGPVGVCANGEMPAGKLKSLCGKEVSRSIGDSEYRNGGECGRGGVRDPIYQVMRA